MSDFLARLGARALGATATVRPAIAPLFGPRAPAVPADVWLQPEDERAQDADEDRLEHRRGSAAAKTHVPSHGFTTSPRGPMAHESLGDARPAGAEDITPPTMQSGVGAAGPAHPHVVVAAAVAPSTPSRRADTHAGEVASPMPPAGPAPLVRRLGEDDDLADDEASRRPDARHPAASVAPERRHGDVSAPAKDDSLAAGLSRLRRIVAGAAPPSISRGGPVETDRIVRISIGRIDVRTVPVTAPPATAGPPERREPQMTLADYLGARNRRRP